MAEAHDWRAAGEARGSHADARDCLYRTFSLDVLIALFGRLGVGPQTTLLDIACGSGLAVRLAAGTGARAAGIDAANDLIAVARERTPTADLRIGSMYALPWADDSFDAAVS